MLMTTLIIGLLIPLLGTMLGSAFVFFMKNDMPERVQKSLLGFASGVMVAASVWSKNSFQKPLQAVTQI
jgi:ZIP family zinc transporter